MRAVLTVLFLVAVFVGFSVAAGHIRMKATPVEPTKWPPPKTAHA